MKRSTAGLITRMLSVGGSKVLTYAVFCVTTEQAAQAGINVWTNIGPPGEQVHALVIDPITPSALYVGTPAGVFKSNDAGATWDLAGEGLTEVTALAIDPISHTLYAGTIGGVFRSPDGGDSWSAANAGLGSAPHVTEIGTDPVTLGTLYAVTVDGGIFKSTDGGGSWSALDFHPYSQDFLQTDPTTLAIDPTTPGTLYAALTLAFAEDCTTVFFKSTDGGDTWDSPPWTAPPPGFNTCLVYRVDALVIDPTTPGTLYAGTGAGIYKSTDGGSTWSIANTGLPPTPGVSAFAIDPTTPGTLYAGTRAGVFKSTDAGASWDALNTGLTAPVRALAIDPTMPSKIYAGTSGGGVFSILQASAKVVGTGTADSCTDAALDAALAEGGDVLFNCGAAPVTIDISTGSGTKTIAADTTIDGTGLITIRNDVFGVRGGVFVISPGVGLVLKNLTIVHSPNAVANYGTLTVANSTFSDNPSGGCDPFEICAGGGIYSTGSLTVAKTSFTNSSIYSLGGVLIVTDCTFAGNNVGILSQGGQSTVSHSTFTGGVAGIITTSLFKHVGSLTVGNSTFSDNSGIGIETFDGSLTVSNCTFSGNCVSIANDHEEPAVLRNTILVHATPDCANNCRGIITDGGHNLDSGTSCGFSTANGSLSNTDPLLDPDGLHDNGGPTQTVALCTAVDEPPGCTAASPAIDAGDQTLCDAEPVNGRDQRGFRRPGTGHTQCSIGAYEADASAEACTGDCDGNSMVAINELVLGVNIVLGPQTVDACPAFANSQGMVDIAQLVQGVNNSLHGCATPTPSVALLVSSFNSGQIAQVDGTSGIVEGLFSPAGAHGLTLAAGMRLGSDGRLYVGGPGALYRFDATTGAFVDSFVPGLPAGGIVFANVAAPDGSVWGTLGPANKIFHADGATGALLGLVDSGRPSGMALGADGKLYVGSLTQNHVSRYDPTTGAFIDVCGTHPSAGSAGAIGGLTFGADGLLYAALSRSSGIVRFDPTTCAYLGSFIPEGERIPESPYNLTFGPDGDLYVTANGPSEVLRYDGTTGAFLGTFAQVDSPFGLAFVPHLPPPFPPILPLPPLDTPSGPVVGQLDGGVRKYLGIPYAEAPIGDLRWRRPVRKARSQTAIFGLTSPARCPQVGGGSEDCLKLSIWRPDSPSTIPLPVLFYIHGGGLYQGSISSGTTDGANLAREQNVIVVEPQYRLGALGFLGLPQLAAEDADGSTGNYGFLDQLEALRWVRDNIAAFGGDPTQVTITGQSAGGWSVCTLLASPLSEGLFRAAIVQSGYCDNARPLTLPAGSPVRNDPYFGDTIYERGDQLAANAGCADDATRLDCLRQASASSLVQAYAALPRNVDNEQPANPAIDGYVLTEQPVVMLRRGAADGRALMIGTVANESTWFSQGWESIFTTPAAYEAILRLAAGDTRTDALLPLYPAASFVTPAEAFRTLIEDAVSVCPTLDSADAAYAGGSPAWVYHLTFPPVYGPGSTQAGQRTFHGLDLYYVFGTYPRLAGDYGIVIGPDDAALSASMQNAWGAFVRTGVPSTTPTWPAYEPATTGDLASVSVLQFDASNEVVPGTAFRSGRCAAFFPVANTLDADRDIATHEEDNCPAIANTDQADADSDGVGDVCDN